MDVHDEENEGIYGYIFVIVLIILYFPPLKSNPHLKFTNESLKYTSWIPCQCGLNEITI